MTTTITQRDTSTLTCVARRSVIGHSMRGCPIELVQHGKGDDVTLIIATIHGEEPAGLILVNALSAHLCQNHADVLDSRTVLIVPIANPDGYAVHRRYNKRGVDLNRNFPAANRNDNNQRTGKHALSEVESRALHAMIEARQPGRIITLHQPLKCIDYDGPGERLALAMSKTCDLPVQKLGARPGSLGAYVEQSLKIPMITVEFSGNAHCSQSDTLWQQYGQMMLAGITAPL